MKFWIPGYLLILSYARLFAGSQSPAWEPAQRRAKGLRAFAQSSLSGWALVKVYGYDLTKTILASSSRANVLPVSKVQLIGIFDL